jgi:hypothetical protein
MNGTDAALEGAADAAPGRATDEPARGSTEGPAEGPVGEAGWVIGSIAAGFDWRAFDCLASFIGEHDRDAVTNRVGEFIGRTNQFLRGAIVMERPLAQRANQDFKQT